MNDFDLNLLPSFIAAARSRSISAAAKDLRLTQPALSLQLLRLEEQFGRKLFDRHRTGLVLTPSGEKLLQQAKELMRTIDALKSAMFEEKDIPHGDLRIATFGSIATVILPDTIASYRKKYPQVAIHLSYPKKSAIVAGLINYEYDLGIVGDADDIANIEKQVLFDDEVYLVGSVKHGNFPDRIKPSELETIPYLAYEAPYDYCYTTISNKFGKYLRKNKSIVVSEYFSVLKELLLLGAGIAFLPSYLVQEEISKQKLKKIEVGNCSFKINYALLTKTNGSHTAAARKFIELLNARLKPQIKVN